MGYMGEDPDSPEFVQEVEFETGRLTLRATVLSGDTPDAAKIVQEAWGAGTKVIIGPPIKFRDFLLRDEKGRICLINVRAEVLRELILKHAPEMEDRTYYGEDAPPWAEPPQ